MCRAGWALHTRLLISFAPCVRHRGCAEQSREGRAGAAHGVHQALPKVPASSLPSGFPAGWLLRAPPVCLLCCRVGTQSSQAGKGSQQHPLPHPALPCAATSQQDAQEGPKLSGNPACPCKPARTILQHLCSLILSCWHRTCGSDHLSAHYPVLSTHFSQQHSFFTGQHQTRPPSAQWHVEGLQNCGMFSWKNSQQLWSSGQVWGKVTVFVPQYLPS